MNGHPDLACGFVGWQTSTVVENLQAEKRVFNGYDCEIANWFCVKGR